jgi:Rieske Fe-S protein
MSDDEKKPTPQPITTPSPSTKALPVPAQPAKQLSPVKKPAISRRAFVVGALSASTLLAIGAFALPDSPSTGILNPLIPTKDPPTVVANYQTQPTSTGTDLNSRYQNVASSADLYDPSKYSEFFYFPYKVKDSPYYKNVITRLPDPLVNPYYPNDPVLSHVAAWNLTCVHLRCIVNPGYAGTPGSGEFRLQCPCHGSQYRLKDGIPVAGPAFDLGLLPLPRVKLTYDPTTGNITATDMDGTAGVGRTD